MDFHSTINTALDYSITGLLAITIPTVILMLGWNYSDFQDRKLTAVQPAQDECDNSTAVQEEPVKEEHSPAAVETFQTLHDKLMAVKPVFSAEALESSAKLDVHKVIPAPRKRRQQGGGGFGA